MEAVTGLTVLLSKFDLLGRAVDVKQLKRAAQAGALLIANEAKRNCPVDTGTLRRSIHVGGDTSSTGDFDGVDLGEGPEGEASVTVYVGTNLEYAPFVEFGTSRMAAQPYLRPAADSEGNAAADEMKAVYKLLIDEASR